MVLLRRGPSPSRGAKEIIDFLTSKLESGLLRLVLRCGRYLEFITVVRECGSRGVRK